MQQLIEGILSYSSLNTEVARERFDLDEALQEAINNLEFRINETRVFIKAEPLPKVWVLPFQMQQVFQNLLANALKFSRPGIPPEIVVSSRKRSAKDIESVKVLKNASKYIEIRIADNGLGFSNDVAEKIFGLFQRLHSKASYEGAGIGLAICRRIVEHHGGTISAFSKEGEGSTFSILLPDI